MVEIRRPCEALTKNGAPCKLKAVLESDPPRCNVHPYDGGKVTQELTARRRAIAKADFLNAYAETGDSAHAADVVGYAYDTIRTWRYNDPVFMNDWEEARIVLIERVEHSLFEQSIGVETATITIEGGIETKRVTTVSRSVAAAALWLRGNDPDRYRDSKHTPPPPPRRTVDEELMKRMMSDPDIRNAMDAVYDADL